MMKSWGKQTAAIVIASAIAGSGAAVYAQDGTITAVPISAPVTESEIAAEYSSYSLQVGGESLLQAGYAKDGFVMIPLRETAEALGYEVKWNANGMIEMSKGNVWTQVQTGVDQYSVNRMYIQLGTAPELAEGLTYVPLAFASEVLHAEVAAQGSAITITAAAEASAESAVEAEETQQLKATITGFRTDEEGHVSAIQVNGAGMNGIVLNIDETTVIQKADGSAVKAEDLSLGTAIDVKHNLAMKMSLPPQVFATSITVTSEAELADSIGTGGTVQEVRTDDEGNVKLLISGFGMTESSPAEVVLNIQEDTLLVDQNGEEVEASVIQEGSEVLAFYSSMLTKSLPPIGNAWKIVVQ